MPPRAQAARSRPLHHQPPASDPKSCPAQSLACPSIAGCSEIITALRETPGCHPVPPVTQPPGSPLPPLSRPWSRCSSFAGGLDEFDFRGSACSLTRAWLSSPRLRLVKNTGNKGVGKHGEEYFTQPKVVPELMYSSKLNPLLSS